MRIISGRCKGRIIVPPRNLRARPTTDFAKENLFNVLAGFGFDYAECDVLDLFAGTGSVSYEFASRGARSVTSVEINAVHYDFIRRTALELGFTGLYPVKANVLNYLRACTRRFDIIFSDAPYDLKGSEEVIALVFERGLLRRGGDVGEAVSVGAVVGEGIDKGGSVAEDCGVGEGACAEEERNVGEGACTEESGTSEGGIDGALVNDKEEVRPGGLLIFEHSKRQDFSGHPRFLQTRNYGSVQFSIFGAGE